MGRGRRRGGAGGRRSDGGRAPAPRLAAARSPEDGGGARLPGGGERRESHADGDWMVRRITGATSTKTYRCPGCAQEIRPATPHVVAWPADAPLLGGDAVEGRRHWHSGCWANRLRRR